MPYCLHTLFNSFIIRNRTLQFKNIHSDEKKTNPYKRDEIKNDSN